MNCPVYMKA